MWIKICGIKTKKELSGLIPLRPDAVGFVIGTKISKRNISLRKAKELIKYVPDPIKKVAVSLNPDAIRKIDDYVDYVQIYEDFYQFKSRIIRSYLCSEFNLKKFRKSEKKIEMVLIDTGYGSGKVHDWRITRHIRESIKKPLVMAGGLTPENVRSAIATVKPFGVDISSGVEIAGEKDYFLMKKFMERARGVENGI